MQINRKREKKTVNEPMEVKKSGTGLGTGRVSRQVGTVGAKVMASGEEATKERIRDKKVKQKQASRYLNKLRENHRKNIETEADPIKRAERDERNRKTKAKMSVQQYMNRVDISRKEKPDLGTLMDYEQDYEFSAEEKRNYGRKQRTKYIQKKNGGGR